MAGTSINSLKSVVASRVDLGEADRQYYASRALGNPATCPRSAHNADVDEFSRPLGGNGYRLLYTADASCSQFTYPLSKLLAHENAERPNLGPCVFGDRGGGDLLAYHRDDIPKNIYGFGQRGNFVSPAPIDEGVPISDALPHQMRPGTLSHDALIAPLRG
jgi:hypothetical protein